MYESHGAHPIDQLIFQQHEYAQIWMGIHPVMGTQGLGTRLYTGLVPRLFTTDLPHSSLGKSVMNSL